MQFHSLDEKILFNVIDYLETKDVEKSLKYKQLIKTATEQTIAKWHTLRKPFYRLYPGVVEAITRMPISAIVKECPNIFHKRDPLLIELPVGHELKQEDQEIRSVLVELVGDCLSLVVTTNNWATGKSMPAPIFTSVEALTTHSEDDIETVLNRLIIGVLLLDNDPELIKPIVIKSDEEKYRESGDLKYVEKAKRRGLNGFDVGKDIPTAEEVRAMSKKMKAEGGSGSKAPHIRIAHLARVWTGKGKKIPKIVRIETLFVNWKKVETMPTGYYTESADS